MFSFLTAKIIGWVSVVLTLGTALFVGRCALKDYWLRQEQNRQLHERVERRNQAVEQANREHREYVQEREKHPVDGDKLTPEEKIDNAFKLLGK